MASKPFQFLNMDADTAIPVPDSSEIAKVKDRVLEHKEERVLHKHEKAYDDFCKWSSIPEKNRKPKTQAEFERKYHLPPHYTTTDFKKRSDYYERYYKYMFEWIRELYPEFIQNQYIQATKNGNSSSIKFFADMVAKDMETQKPRATIQPFVIMGVPQEKINKLFIPDGMEKIEDVTPNK